MSAKQDGPRERGERMLKEGGYHKFRDGGDIHAGGASDAAEDKKLIRKALREHDQQLHHGKHTKVSLKGGGKVHGKKGKERPDRRARGGHVSDFHQSPPSDDGRARGGMLIGEPPHDAMGNRVKDSALARGGKVAKGHGKVVVNVHTAPPVGAMRPPGAAMGAPPGLPPHPPMPPMAAPPGGPPGLPPGPGPGIGGPPGLPPKPPGMP